MTRSWHVWQGRGVANPYQSAFELQLEVGYNPGKERSR